MSKLKDFVKAAAAQAVVEKVAEKVQPVAVPTVHEYVVLSVKSQLARVLLRYVAMGMISAGAMTAGFGEVVMNDPELIGLATAAVGAGISFLTERKFYKALKEG